jgi:uncharacterized membrane protein (UPF0182 family)
MGGDGEEGEGRRSTPPNPRRVKGIVVVCLIVAALGIVSKGSGWLVEWLWMREVGYTQIFVRLFSIKVLLFFAAALPVFFFLWVNLKVAVRHRHLTVVDMKASRSPDFYEFQASPKILTLSIMFFSVIPALGFGIALASGWDNFIRFFWGGPMGAVDPVFGRDIGFYLLRLPFYETLQSASAVLAFLSLPITFLGYLLTRQVALNPPFVMNRRMFRHLSILFSLFIAAWATGYYLNLFDLLYQKRGVVYGAGYTDFHVVRPALWIMIVASALFISFVLWNMRRAQIKPVLIAAGGYVVLMIVAVGIVPSVIQSYVVQPNELALEKPFLAHNIALTRQAYGLDKVEERPFQGGSDLSLAAVSANQDTLKNIRLWDWKPILQTFRQTQEMRLYYRFHEVDVDRYRLPGDQYRQVMLSGRELSEQVLQQARTWVNEHLEFTHGYGLTMAYVSETGEGGLPRMLIKDLPPASPLIKLDRPAIYYGENMGGYAIVRSGVEEFDYPKGDKNVYTRYDGTGGIPIGTLWRRALFAWHLLDSNILVSGYIKPESRIQLYRTVRERVARIAPFLSLDPDPYLVVSEGRLFWIQDGYTISSRYPYSEPYSDRLNYIRNSVKTVIDAYNGSVTFYAADPGDPILRAYTGAFPGAFKPFSEMPPDLRGHVRYPEDLFKVQTDRLTTYHMTDPRVFYNKEDVWALPAQKHSGDSQAEMEPYYALIRLPGTKELQYLLMQPMTPLKRANMVAWVSAACDFPNYGKLVLFQLPKERLIYGPMQIEAIIDQEPAVSQQLSLWDQRGSKVIRGNLLVIPIENSFLYIEPVYLVAEQVNIPQLIRVIVAYGSKVSMQPTLEEAIRAVFGGVSTPAASATPAVSSAPTALSAQAPGTPPSLEALGKARKEFQAAEEALKRGQWAEFGRAMESLKKALGK